MRVILFFAAALHFIWGILEADVQAEEQRLALVKSHLKAIDVIEPTSALPLVDCLYVINLDHRPDRWAWMKSQCEQHRLLPNRVSAVDGWALSEQTKLELTYPYPCRLRGGQFGCLLSHLSVLQDALQRHFDVIWVMEDDVEFVEDPRLLTALLTELTLWDPDWDVLFTDSDFRDKNTGYIQSVSSDFPPDLCDKMLSYYTERVKINDTLMQIRSRFGTYSMLISKKGVAKILHYFASHPFWTAIDIEMHYIPGLREYAACQDIVSNLRDSPSDTEATHYALKTDLHP